MNVAGDSAEQVVRFSLEAFEVIAKLTGSGAKEALAMMFAILKDREDKSVGKTRLENMLKTCKNMDIFSIQKKDLNKYQEQAKKYGIKFCALMDKNDKSQDGIVDLLVRSEDAKRINRIVERFNLSVVDTASLRTENVISKEKEEESKEDIISDILGEKNIVDNSEFEIIKESDGVSKDFFTQKNPSENSSMNKGGLESERKESVRKILKEIAKENNKDTNEKGTQEIKTKTRKNKSKIKKVKGREK